jgi:hypothetical protein
VKCGKINCQNLPHVCRNAGIIAYPTVKLYIGTKNQIKQNPEGANVEAFSAQEIVEFVSDYLSSHNEQVRQLNIIFNKRF